MFEKVHWKWPKAIIKIYKMYSDTRVFIEAFRNWKLQFFSELTSPEIFLSNISETEAEI